MAAHFLRRNHGTESPANYLFFDCETLPYCEQGRERTICHRLRLGVAAAIRLEKGRVTRRRVLCFRDPAEFWAFVAERLHQRQPLYLIAHNLGFDWRLVGGWRVIEDNSPRKWKIVISDPPTILRGKIEGCRIVALDSRNWFPGTLESIGQGVGLPKLPMPPSTASDQDWIIYCTRDVEIIETAIVRFIRWWRERDLGVFGQTIAKCGWNAYRHRWLKTDLLHHECEEAYLIERGAYYGGEVALAHAGMIGSDVYHLDVNALYPSVMRQRLYPSQLVRYRPDATVSWLKGCTDLPQTAARVWIDTRERSYPRRDSGGVHYPVGYYRTCLCGPELQQAVESGHVIGCEGACIYEMRDIFNSWAEDWWTMRVAAKETGNLFDESVIKLLMNSLNGKFGQRSEWWQEREFIVPPFAWGEWPGWDFTSKKDQWYRAIAGVVQERVHLGEPATSMPSVAAWITSYGRQEMRRLRTIAGGGHWYYQDTDSLFVSETGLTRLLDAGELHTRQLGRLKLVERSPWAWFHGPKHYQMGLRRVWAGVPATHDEVDMCRYGFWEFEGLRYSLDRQDAESNEQHYRIAAYPHIPIDGVVQLGGAVTPAERCDLTDRLRMEDIEARPKAIHYLEALESLEPPPPQAGPSSASA